MNRTMCHLILALAAMSTVSGCATRSVVAPEQVTPRSEISLRFDPSRAVALRTASGDARIVDRVFELRGQLIEASADSVLIQVADVQFPDGRIERFGEGAIASFSQAEVTMEEVEFSGGKTALFVIGLLGFLVFLVMRQWQTTTEEILIPSPKY